tara:strand:- start:2803 stop:3291 length:489 start_codon:yes stop_codon:yes gene_type:complete
MSDENKWSQPAAPPPPLFLGEKERNYVKQVNDELIEKVVGQDLLYYPISLEHTNFHPIYGESINKVYYPPIRVYALVTWQGYSTETTSLGIDRRPSIKINFHKRRLTEDQDVFVREGDFVLYGESFYEIVTLNEPMQMFGQIEHRMEIEATCIKARKGVFNG